MTLDKAHMTYRALRLHFTQESYNIFKTQGRVKGVKEESLDKNLRLKHFLEKYRKKHKTLPEFIDFLVAQFSSGDEYGGVYNGNPDEVYNKWKGRKDSLTRVFREDLQRCPELANKSAHTVQTQPPVMKAFYGEKISLETVCILNKLCHFLDEIHNPDPLWKSFEFRIRKYSPFMTVDRDRFNHIMRGVYESNVSCEERT